MAQFDAARQAPYATWLTALGMPPGGDAGLGVRGEALVAFFSHPDVQRMARLLQLAGVDGF